MSDLAAGEILVVDDDRKVVEILSSVISGLGHRVQVAYSAEAALEMLGSQYFDVAFVDHRLPGKTGLELLSLVRENWPSTEMVMVTGSANVKVAVAAMKAGAADFVTKPFTPELIRITTERVMEKQQLRRQNRWLRQLSSGAYTVKMPVAKSHAMKRLLSIMETISDSESTVLICGEPGAGKEMVARSLHHTGARNDAPFVVVDCTSIPESLMESIFFGHEKGSFTGADKLKPGMVEVAHTGTLFLDEIAEMPPGLQAKLLRFIQEKTFRRVGGAQEHRVDVRVIAATNRDLETMVREKSFRADLFYRLQVIVLDVPPLRDRVADIVPLAREFLDRFSRRCRKTVEGFTERAERILETYQWPGNVRELENTIERLVVFCRGEVIDASAVASVLGLPAGALEAGKCPEVKLDVALPLELPWKDFRDLGLRALKKPYAEKLLELTGGNVTEAARRAGVARRSFYRLLQEPEEERETPTARAVPRPAPEIQA